MFYWGSSKECVGVDELWFCGARPDNNLCGREIGPAVLGAFIMAGKGPVGAIYGLASFC